MSSPVRLEAESFADPRFGVVGQRLAELQGWACPIMAAGDFGRGAMARVYSVLTDRGTDQLTAAEIDAVLLVTGASDAVVEANLGVRVTSGPLVLAGGAGGVIRLRGASADRVRWRAAGVEQRREAGRKRAKQAARVGGRFTSGKPADIEKSRTSSQRRTSEPPASAGQALAPADQLSGSGSGSGSSNTSASAARARGREAGGQQPAKVRSLTRTAVSLWDEYVRASERHELPHRERVPGDERRVVALLDDGWSVAQVRRALWALAERAAAHESEREWWDGKRCWSAEVLREALSKQTAAAPGKGTQGKRDPAVGYAEPSTTFRGGDQ